MRSRAMRRSVSSALLVWVMLFAIVYVHQLLRLECVRQLRRSDPPHPTPLPCGEREPTELAALFELHLLSRSEPEQMAHGVDQVGAVHSVEVEVGDAAIDEVEHLLGGDRGGDELAGG